ncbi:MAG: Nudix family hydrolase, partial [Gammaproteobacteria bacterium]
QLEFPGGKLQTDEAPETALARELHEELGIAEARAQPLIRFEHDYPGFRAHVHLYSVSAWRGDPQGCEGQRLLWASTRELRDLPLLPANRPALAALELPATLMIVPQSSPDDLEVFCRRFEKAMANEQVGGAILRWRDSALPSALAATMVAAAHGKILLLNAGAVTEPPPGFAGMHLPAAALMRLDARPDVAGRIGASVHTIEEAAQARRLGLDYAIAGSVRATPSHPSIEPLGWNGFEKIAAAAGIPTYAIGGMAPADLPAVQACWGQGIAAIRAFQDG